MKIPRITKQQFAEYRITINDDDDFEKSETFLFVNEKGKLINKNKVQIRNFKCKICGIVFPFIGETGNKSNKKRMSSHLKGSHNISPEEYTKKYYYNNTHPICAINGCLEQMRYESFEFTKYCDKHGSSEGGKEGGKDKETWSKGLTKETDHRIAKQAENQKGDKNHFWGETHTPESLKKMAEGRKIKKDVYNERVNSRLDFFRCKTLHENYTSRQHQYLDFECVLCNRIEQITLQAFERGSLCYICFPQSQQQLELYNYIKSLIPNEEVISGDDEQIYPKEIDIYIPSRKIGIEFDGLRFHSEFIKTPEQKNYHKDKTESCDKIGISLIHVFSDEWQQRKEIIKSMIKNRLGIYDVKINARKCEFVQTKDKNEEEVFFENNHVSGKCNSIYCFGLKFNNEIVCAVSFRKPFTKKYGENVIEIARFASKIDTQVVGGFSKIISNCLDFLRKEGFVKILTYSDLRFGKGKVYESNGFRKIEEKSDLNYWYTNGREKFNRQQFMAKDGKSEKQVAEEAGVKRIYGCGNNTFVMDL